MAVIEISYYKVGLFTETGQSSLFAGDDFPRLRLRKFQDCECYCCLRDVIVGLSRMYEKISYISFTLLVH